jgi:hypothetical protein
MDRGSPNRVFAHDGQFLFSSGYGGLDRGDLAQPTLFLGFPQPVDEVGVDPFQPRHLSRVDPE